MQVSVVSQQELLDAQQHPEQHSDLIVRIGGYSEWFTRLGADLQNSVIERCEHLA